MTLLLGTVELSQHSPWSDLQFPLFCFTMENYIQVYWAYIFLRRELEKSLLQKQRTFVCRRTELCSGNPSLFLIAKTDTQLPVSSRSIALGAFTFPLRGKPMSPEQRSMADLPRWDVTANSRESQGWWT